jgi:hypothetical protein
MYTVLPFQIWHLDFIFQNPLGWSLKNYWILTINIDSFFRVFSWLSRPITQWDLLYCFFLL